MGWARKRCYSATTEAVGEAPSVMPEAVTTEHVIQPFDAARAPVAIRTVDDIQKLLASPRMVRRLPRGGFIVAIPGLDERTKNEFQSELNRYIRDCGCTAGGITFLTATAAFIACAVEATLNEIWIDLMRTIIAGLIGVPILTVIGKWLGLFIARLRFRRSCARLIRPWRSGSNSQPDR